MITIGIRGGFLRVRYAAALDLMRRLNDFGVSVCIELIADPVARMLAEEFFGVSSAEAVFDNYCEIVRPINGKWPTSEFDVGEVFEKIAESFYLALGLYRLEAILNLYEEDELTEVLIIPDVPGYLTDEDAKSRGIVLVDGSDIRSIDLLAGRLRDAVRPFIRIVRTNGGGS